MFHVKHYLPMQNSLKIMSNISSLSVFLLISEISLIAALTSSAARETSLKLIFSRIPMLFIMCVYSLSDEIVGPLDVFTRFLIF